jgi:hypothetical protein
VAAARVALRTRDSQMTRQTVAGETSAIRAMAVTRMAGMKFSNGTRPAYSPVSRTLRGHSTVVVAAASTSAPNTLSIHTAMTASPVTFVAVPKLSCAR